MSSNHVDEIEEKTIKIFLSHVKDLEQQEELVIESSDEIMMSCGFTTDKLCMNAGIVEDKPFYGIVLNEAENCQVKYDDDYNSNEHHVELLQQKEFINSMTNGGNIFNGDDIVVSYNKKFAIEENNVEFIFLND